MKLFVVVEDYQSYYLKKELCTSSHIKSGNWILKKNKTLNAYNSWQDYARKKIQLPSERSESKLSFRQRKMLESFEIVCDMNFLSWGCFADLAETTNIWGV